MSAGLTILSRYAITGATNAAATAFRALSARVDRDGERGIAAYRFWLDEVHLEARAVIDYAGPEAWIGHHDLSMGWPEMQALHAVARLEEVVFLGPVTDEMTRWIDASAISASVKAGYEPVAGFTRLARPQPSLGA